MKTTRRTRERSAPQLYVHGVTVEEWSRRWGVKPFTTPCHGCGAPLTTSIPFVRGTLRGLEAPPCENGCHKTYTDWLAAGASMKHKGVINHPPYAVVRDPKYGDLFDMGARLDR